MFNSQDDRESPRPCDVDDSSVVLSSSEFHSVELKGSSKSLRRGLHLKSADSGLSFKRDSMTTDHFHHHHTIEQQNSLFHEEARTTQDSSFKFIPSKEDADGCCFGDKDEDLEDRKEGEEQIASANNDLLLLDSASDLFHLTTTNGGGGDDSSSFRNLLNRIRKKTKNWNYTSSSKCSLSLANNALSFSYNSEDNSQEEGTLMMTSRQRSHLYRGDGHVVPSYNRMNCPILSSSLTNYQQMRLLSSSCSSSCCSEQFSLLEKESNLDSWSLIEETQQHSSSFNRSNLESGLLHDYSSYSVDKDLLSLPKPGTATTNTTGKIPMTITPSTSIPSMTINQEKKSNLLPRDGIAKFRNYLHQFSGLESFSGIVCKFHPVGGESSSSGGLRTLIGSPDATITLSSDVQMTSPSSQERTIVGGGGSDITSVNEYGFFTNERPFGDLPPVTNYPELTRHRESKRNQKWRQMLGDNTEDNWKLIFDKEQRLLKKRIRKGIPKDWRYRIWPLLTGGRYFLETFPEEYQRLLRRPSEKDKEINDDVHRTLPTHVLFAEPGGEGQQALFRILKAYSVYDPEIGYAQGTGVIVAMLLVVLEEEIAFWTFVALMSEPPETVESPSFGSFLGCRRLFLEGTPLTLEMMSKMEHLLQERLPTVMKRLREQDIIPTQYGTKWWMSLFCFVLPFQHVLRVWDVFFLEGWDIALKTCVAIMKFLEPTILSTNRDHVGTIVTTPIIGEHIPPPDIFMRTMLRVKTSRSLRTWSGISQECSTHEGTDHP